MFDIRSLVLNEDEDNRRELNDYIRQLDEAFADSDEGQEWLAQGHDLGAWVQMFVELSATYTGCTPAEATAATMREVLYRLFPRKVSVEPEQAPEVVGELRAFWQFARRAYALPNADAILKELDERAVAALRRELGNTENFGMAKSFFAMGAAAGFDMSSQAGLDQYLEVVNARDISEAEAPRTGPSRAASRSSMSFPPLTRQERKARQKQLEKALRRKRK